MELIITASIVTISVVRTYDSQSIVTCLFFSICFLHPPSVGVVLRGRKTSLVSHFQDSLSNMKWISTTSIFTTFVVTKYVVTLSGRIVIVSVVSIVVIISNFRVVSTFSLVMGLTTLVDTTFSIDLKLMCYFGMFSYNI